MATKDDDLAGLDIWEDAEGDSPNDELGEEVYYDYIDAVIELRSTYNHCQRYIIDEEDYE
jgi:hypothetical protein